WSVTGVQTCALPILLGEVAHRHRALHRLALGGGERLSHLARHEFGHDRNLTFEELGGTIHRFGALSKRRFFPTRVGARRRLERLIDVLGRVRRVLGDYLFSGWGCCNKGHSSSLPAKPLIASRANPSPPRNPG